MSTLLIIILIPIVITWICRFIWPHQISWAEMGVAIVAAVSISGAIYGTGLYGQTADVEVINGQVVSKDRKHDTYLRSYSCNCRQVCSGSGSNRSCTSQCSTCYETRYTVSWKCRTNIGDYTIEHLDRSSRSVYNTPDPARYTSIQVGDPVARTNIYTNYVKAVPESLFHKNRVEKFKPLIPAYPSNIYDFYNVDRVLAMGVPVPDIALWNKDLALLLRKLGPQKQANAVIVFANTNDQSYIHALEGEWIGGKKNDIIIVIGTTAYPKIDWVAVSSWTDNQLFKVQLRDDIMSHGTIDRTKIMEALDRNTMTQYKRKSMEDFKYLEDQIEPPMWVLTLSVILGILISVGASFYFYRNDPFHTGSSVSRRRPYR